jgi:hypothetical protein
MRQLLSRQRRRSVRFSLESDRFKRSDAVTASFKPAVAGFPSGRGGVSASIRCSALPPTRALNQPPGGRFSNSSPKSGGEAVSEADTPCAGSTKRTGRANRRPNHSLILGFPRCEAHARDTSLRRPPIRQHVAVTGPRVAATYPDPAASDAGPNAPRPPGPGLAPRTTTRTPARS